MTSVTQTPVKDMKRFNLLIPQELYEELERVAETEHLSVTDAFRRAVKLYLLAFRLSQKPDTQFVIREGDSEKEVMIFLG